MLDESKILINAIIKVCFFLERRYLIYLFFIHFLSFAAERFSGEVNLELQNDNAYKSDDSDKKFNDLYVVVESAFSMIFSDSLSLLASIVIEPILDSTTGENRQFKDEGGVIEELKVIYETAKIEFYAGKYNPSFGLMWDLANGLYGADLAKEYEIASMIGLGILIKIESESKQSISLNSFCSDTSYFSKTTHNESERLNIEDGGAGNTGELSSFTLSYDSEIFTNFKYQMAYRFLKEGLDSVDDE